MNIIKEIIDIPLSISALILFFLCCVLMSVGSKIGEFAEKIPCTLSKDFQMSEEKKIRW